MIAVYIDKKINRFKREVRYTLDFIFHSLGLEYRYILKLDELKPNDILLVYGLIRPNLKEAYVLALKRILVYIPFCLQLYSDLTDHQKERLKEDVLSKSIGNSNDLPKEDGNPLREKVICESDIYYISLGHDLIGKTFLHLYQTRGNPDLKEKKNNKGNMKYLYPQVNILINYLEKLLLKAVREFPPHFLVKKELWPRGEDFAFSMTHSVSSLEKWNFIKIVQSTLGNLLVLYKVNYLFRDLISKIKFILTNIEQYWNFDLINELEEKYGIRSTFFWGVERHGSGGVDYDIEDPDCEREMQTQRQENCEIALLAGQNSDRTDNHDAQRKKLERKTGSGISGIRISGCGFKPDLTVELLNRNGFSYDSTIIDPEMIGFPGGIGLPYYPFYKNNEQDKTSHYIRRFCLELPVVFSDEALKLSRFKILSRELGEELIRDLLTEARKNGALLVFDFSLPNFADIYYNKQLYEHLLENIVKESVYSGTLSEISRWWKFRESVKITERERGFEIFFPEKTADFAARISGSGYKLKIPEGNIKLVQDTIYFRDIARNSRFYFEMIRTI